MKQWWRILIPRNGDFFDLFDKQAEIAHESVAILKHMIVAEEVNSWWYTQMRDIEHRADNVTSQIIRKAEQMFSAPFDAEDIYALAVAVDDVVDEVEEMVERVVDYDMIPDDVLRKFFFYVAQGITHIQNGVKTLRRLDRQDECRRQMTDCEHAADALLKPIIPQSRVMCVSVLLKKVGSDTVTVDEIQTILNAYTYKRMHREIAELAEASVDACKKVFHMLGNIYLKET